MSNNPFTNRTLVVGGPARDIAPVTPNDTTDLPEVAFGLKIMGAGNITIITERGQTRTIPVTADSEIYVGVRRVLATGTTATQIFAFYF